MNGNSGQRLSKCGRLRRARWLPDGKGIIALRQVMGRGELLRLDPEGVVERVLWSGGEGDVVGSFDIAPDGQSLVASVNRAAGRWRLERFTFADESWQPLPVVADMQTDPRFSRDGRTILFAADSNSIYNIHRLDLATGRVTRQTDVFGGAFKPVMTADGTLYYTGYTSEGYDLFQYGTPRTLDVAVQKSPPPPVPPVPTRSVPTTSVKEYSALESVAPRWWFPNFFITDVITEVGLQTAGSDVLDRHTYGLLAIYETGQGLFSGRAQLRTYDWPLSIVAPPCGAELQLRCGRE